MAHDQIKLNLLYSNKSLYILFNLLYEHCIELLFIIRGALVLRAAIRQTLFHQNVLRGNSSM